MSIDVSTAQAELTSVLRCSVSLAHADEYVKAFYKPPGELVEWGIEHSAYSAKQLLSLVNLMPLKKKARAHATTAARSAARARARTRAPDLRVPNRQPTRAARARARARAGA